MPPLFPEPGTLLAERYRVVRPIGRGGMGVVLEAEHAVTGRRVAIKLMRPEWGEGHEAYERLVREATAAARIQHVNVVAVYDVFRDGTAVFLVMELLRGETLRDWLRGLARPPHAIVGVLIAAMRGVAEAHRQGVIHRDIHPANIFLARQGNDPEPVPKVLDFGIAKIVGPGAELATRDKICMGTPQYASYEQLTNARDVDERTDVYGFGVLLYEGLTGRPPFEGSSFVEVARQMVRGAPTHPQALCPELPRPLAELTLSAIARDRDDRIGSLHGLVRALEPYADPRAFEPAPRSARRSLLALAGLARSARPRRPASPTLLASGATCVALLGMLAWLAQVRPAPTGTARRGLPAAVLDDAPATVDVDLRMTPPVFVPVPRAAPVPDIALPAPPPEPPPPSKPALPVLPARPARPVLPVRESPTPRCSAPRFDGPGHDGRVRALRFEACEHDASRVPCGRAS